MAVDATVLQIVVRQEIQAVAEQRVLPRSVAMAIADAAMQITLAHGISFLAKMKSEERLATEYEAIKHVAASPEFAGRVTLFVYNDADHLAEALRQIDRDKIDAALSRDVTKGFAP